MATMTLPKEKTSTMKVVVQQITFNKLKFYCIVEQKDKKGTFIIQNKGCFILHTLES